MNKKVITFFLCSLFSIHSLVSQEIKCPAIWGIAKMTFLVSDMDKAREYYGRFLGFDEAFSYPSPLGKVVSFKVNDRQFIEFIIDKKAKEKKRLVSVSLETESIKEMQHYLQSQGVNVSPRKTDGAGNEVVTTLDNSGNTIEFIHLKATGLHRKSKGQFLSPARISRRIHHAGLYAKSMEEEDTFWVSILKCKEIVRYPLDKAQPATIQYLSFRDCTENIEHYSPCDENFSHPCFLVDDMQETIYALKERRKGQTLNPPSIGKTRRWLLNLLAPDNTKIEFTEAYCIK